MTDKTESLVPCPLCGARPIFNLRPTNADASEYLAWASCFCGGYVANMHHSATAENPDEAEATARAAWNAAGAYAEGLRVERDALRDDRDSWQQQASDRVADAVQFAQERDALRAERDALRAFLRA